MGAACSHKKAGVAKEPHDGQVGLSPGKNAEQAPPPSGSAGSTTGGAKAGEPETTVTAPAASPDPAVAPTSTPVADPVDNFRPGEGTGAYLLQCPEVNISLVSQYAKVTPSSEQGVILLQVKPPPYVQIPETRFVLQGGRRVLKQNISTMKSTAQAKSKFCEVIMEFVRLTGTYHGFLWESALVGEAAQPFSIFYLEQQRKLRAAEDEQGRGEEGVAKEETPAAAAPTETERPVVAANEGEGAPEEDKQEVETVSKEGSKDTGGNEAEHGGAKAVDEGDGAKKETAEDEKGTGDADARERGTHGKDAEEGAVKDTHEKEVDGGPGNDNGKEEGANGGDDDRLVVCYLTPGGSVSHRLLVNCGVLPLPLDKAKELIPEFRPVDRPAELQGVVAENGGFYVFEDKAIP
ncbi:hypothetical protein CSUI_001822 [Cystoisospora suis]|uniref:Immune mapped protein 2 N-terminal domain-containing protein n=1 Tax=Cystoisospora suis TaxID=483139 RepID=A0A2C6KW45_9APIC|nr:hypothetical protein CSUI_001822 [Cystoisospora suis]